MKKRTIFAILLTCLTLFLLRNFWLVSKPIDFSFDMNGKEKYQIEAILNPVYNDVWEGKQVVKKAINLSKKSKFKGDFNIKKCKNFKLTFKQDVLSTYPPYIYVTDIIFNKGNFHINDYSKFKADGAELKIEKNGLKIIPKFRIFYCL